MEASWWLGRVKWSSGATHVSSWGGGGKRRVELLYSASMASAEQK
jgi:hypothetical protein